MKKRVKGVSDDAVPLEGEVNQAENAAQSSTQSPSKEEGEEPEATEGWEIYFILNDHQGGKVIEGMFSCFCLMRYIF